MPSRTITICNKKGLHARAAAKFVKCASAFQADIRVKRLNPPQQTELLEDDHSVGGRSILGLMMLGAATGTVLEISAQGEDAAQAIEAIASLVEARFEEEE